VGRFLRIFLWAIVLVFVAASSVVWWYVYRPLPQLDGTLPLPGLQQPVTVDRDAWGVPHIRANSLNDLLEAQGYVMAQDRLWQLDLLRRAARGELSEIFGQPALERDRSLRTLGFARAAERDAALLDPESRAALEAYARGVNHYIETHQNRLPIEFSLLQYKPRPWTPADTLLVTAYMYQTLTNSWRAELNREAVTGRVGPERARDLYSQQSEMDHYIVGGRDPADPHDSDDEDDDDDMPTDWVVKTSGHGAPKPSVSPPAPDLKAELWQSTQRLFAADITEEDRLSIGSNNWVVSGAHTASGKPLLANDTHLELSLPGFWYEVHLTAPGWNVKGFTLPGSPLVVIGHNDRVAWGFTNNRADVQDLFVETFDKSNPDLYLLRTGKTLAHTNWLKAEVRDELIRVKGQPDEHLKVVVTRHGPIIKRDGEKAYALQWTALEPGALSRSYLWLGRTHNWNEFREEMKRVWGPAQNAVYADVDGNIGYIMAAHVPVRKKGHGGMPVPGDTDEYEWTGYIPFEQLPQILNPEGGLIATANARVVGPKYKPYLTEAWDGPYRTARIYDLLTDKRGLRPEDMLKVETDVFTYPHAIFARELLAAGKTVQPSDPRARELLGRLKDWNGMAGADQPEVSFVDFARGEAMALLLEPVLGGDAPLYNWRGGIFLDKVLAERPERWLPKKFKTYDELLAAAEDRAVGRLERETGSARISAWKWSRFDSLEILHPLGRQGLLRWLLSISGKPQNGTRYSPRAAMPTHGPAMRFTADLSNWDASLMQLPAGESGQPGSSHYSDQFHYWYKGKPIAAPFSEAAEEKARRHRLTLTPGP
jgi:penicillin amidase